MQHPMLNIAIRAARRAGQIINRASLDLAIIKIQAKQHNDFVTEVDRAAEAAIIETLLGAYPDHAVLAEESGYTGKPDAPCQWIVDPLDGTHNFIHGFPYYCISIALQESNTLTQAVIYDPIHNDLFTASRGYGATLNNRRIRVSRRDRLSTALIGTGFAHRKLQDTSLTSYIKLFTEMTQSCAGLRRPGAAALDMANVAAGRLDGFFEQGLHRWDIAAGCLLVTEAGGLVGDYRGEADFLDTGEILCANSKLYAQMVHITNPYSQPA